MIAPRDGSSPRRRLPVEDDGNRRHGVVISGRVEHKPPAVTCDTVNCSRPYAKKRRWITRINAGDAGIQRDRHRWQARLGGSYSASPVFADGRIYFQSEEGVVTVVAPGKEFRRLAASRLDGGMLASLAVSGGSIFIRTETHLYRIRQM